MSSNIRRGRLLAYAALASLAAPMSLAIPAVPAAAQAEGDLSRAVTALRAIKTMSADFTQVDRNGQQLTGKMVLKRPGKIRFEYQKDVPVLIVSDGSRLTMLDYEVRQKQVWPISNSPLGALLDPGKDVMRFGKLMPTRHPDLVSVQVKDPKHPEYGTITLIFNRDASAPGGLQLESWVSVDSQNKITKIFLSNQRYGIPVSDGTFAFKDIRPRQKR
ncbi:outer membrane lipoprotein carrier protein LolA [Croceicoccus marinus]|uniref:Outer membrane lipoprotein carrier protein LolA n=2 Tax=Croceicoccus marinus TaxID=450378 RepID=A0A7G6VVL4_9SPHN|nr:outer membrane lipoprotein carrier protein LolA [Croceicoccus marinus]